MARDTLLNLKITPDSSVKDLESLFPGAQSLVMDILEGISLDLEKDALAALQTTVPVYTRQLRDTMIGAKSENYKLKKGFSIYVSDKKHTNTTGKRRKPTGAELAKILDQGYEIPGQDLKRRKNAVPAFSKLEGLTAPSKGERTASWIGTALDAFERSLDKLG